MKNLFEIDNNEIKRILSLHEESTKKQYLNVISEQTDESVTVPTTVTIKSGNQDDDVKVPNSTKFSKTNDPNILITDKDKFYRDKGSLAINDKLTYNCSTGKFKFTQNSKLYNNEDLESKILKPFCQTGSQQNTQAKTDTNSEQEIKKSPFNGLNYILQNKQEFKNPIGGETIGANPGTVVTVDQNSKQLNIGKMFRFSCKPITISETPIYYKGWDGKKNYINVGSSLTNMLRKRYCKGTELKSNEEILGKQNTEVNTKKSTQSVNPQAFTTQSTELTKQIQTSLGNTSPTGSITDADLDLILTQLKQS